MVWANMALTAQAYQPLCRIQPQPHEIIQHVPQCGHCHPASHLRLLYRGCSMLQHRLTITCLQPPLSQQLPGYVHAQQGSQHDHPPHTLVQPFMWQPAHPKVQTVGKICLYGTDPWAPRPTPPPLTHTPKHTPHPPPGVGPADRPAPAPAAPAACGAAGQRTPPQPR
jgi:hypothetical protein